MKLQAFRAMSTGGTGTAQKWEAAGSAARHAVQRRFVRDTDRAQASPVARRAPRVREHRSGRTRAGVRRARSSSSSDDPGGSEPGEPGLDHLPLDVQARVKRILDAEARRILAERGAR